MFVGSVGICCDLREYFCTFYNRGFNNKCFDDCMCAEGEFVFRGGEFLRFEDYEIFFFLEVSFVLSGGGG